MKKAIFFLGFRIFFASAVFYAVLSMLLWFFVYRGEIGYYNTIAPQYWHGHEMVFGYSMAVVAGFLLTAVGNWTGQAMPHGKELFWIWLPWLVARIIFLIAPRYYVLGVCADILFTFLLLWAIAKPVIMVKQWRQMGIISKIVLMIPANLFCLVALYGWSIGWRYGLYLGVFLIIGLVLTIGRRVTPFFLSRGLGEPFEPKNSAILDRLSMIGLVLFFIFEIFTPYLFLSSLSAMFTAVVQFMRLLGWYHKKIWKKPLLWSMYLSMLFIVLSLALYSLRLLLPTTITTSLAMHIMALGGIGLLSSSMIARVSLGHTGRNVHQPPKVVAFALVLLLISTITRSLVPLLFPKSYLFLVSCAQITWIISFALIFVAYLSIWTAPRIDGKAG